MNPFTVLPPKVRLYVYALIALAAVAFSAWQAADGDWAQFIGGLVVALSHMTAAANVDTSGEDEAA